MSLLRQGAGDIPIPGSVSYIGRIIKGATREIVTPTHIRLVPSGNGVSSAFPH